MGFLKLSVRNRKSDRFQSRWQNGCGTMVATLWVIGIHRVLQIIAALLRLFPSKENHEDIK